MEPTMPPFGTTHQIIITRISTRTITTITITQDITIIMPTQLSLHMLAVLEVRGEPGEPLVLAPQQELVGQANEEALEVAVR